MILGAGYDTISINLRNPSALEAKYASHKRVSDWGLKYIKTPFFYLSGDRLDTSYNQTNNASLRKIQSIDDTIHEYRYNRIDCFIDIDSDLSLLSRNFNYPKKVDKALYSNNGSFYKGREVGLRIYDKKLEMGRKKSEKISGFYPLATNVWRIEFQLRYPKKHWFSNESLFHQIENLYFPFMELNAWAKSGKETPYKVLIARVLKNHGREPIQDILALEKNPTRKNALKQLLLSSLEEVSLYNVIQEGLNKIKVLTNESDIQVKYNHDRFIQITSKTYT
jgi:hypothetical protein